MGIFNDNSQNDHSGHIKLADERGPTGPQGPPGVGYKITDDGNYDIDGKRLTNLADSTDDSDAINLKVLKEMILKLVKIIIIYNPVSKFIKNLVTRVN